MGLTTTTTTPLPSCTVQYDADNPSRKPRRSC